LSASLASGAGAQPVPIRIGDQVSGSIDTPGELDLYEFNATAGQRIYLDRTAVSNPSGLHWQLEDRFGRVLLSNFFRLDDLGPVSLMGGTYTITVLGATGGTGTYEFRLWEVLDGGPTAIALDQTVSGGIAVPGQKQVYTFSAAAGQSVFLDQTATSNSAGLNWILEDEFGRALVPRTLNLFDAGLFTLVGGTYTLTVLGEGDQTGTYGLVVRSVDHDGPTSILIGQAVSGAIDTPGQKDLYTFSAPQDQIVILDQTATSNSAGLNWILEEEFGRVVLARTTNLNDTAAIALVGGNYTLTVIGEGDQTGTYSFVVQDSGLSSYVPSGTTIGIGDVVSDGIGVPNEVDSYVFDVSSGQGIYLDMQVGDLQLRWTLRDPAGRDLFTQQPAQNSNDQGPFHLAAGTYTLLLQATAGDTPLYTFQIFEAEEQQVPLPIDTPVTGTFLKPGDRIVLQFSVQGAPRRLYFDNLAAAFQLFWTLEDPVGETIFERVRLDSADARDQGPMTLPAGEYRLVLHAETGVLPTYQLRVASVVDEASPVAFNQTVEENLSGPGATATFSFQALDGHVMLFDLLENVSFLRWSLIDPVGTPVFPDSSADNAIARDQGHFRLAEGNYSLVFGALLGRAPAFSFKIDAYEPAPPPTCPAGVTAEPERCDGLDNDCDGQLDEDSLGNWDIYQGGVLLGTISPMSTSKSAVDFYRYSTPFGFSYNGPTLAPAWQESVVFFQRDTRTDELSLFIVHDRPGNPSPDGGAAAFTLGGLGSGAHEVETDDASENEFGDFDGQGNASFSWQYGSCCTDGTAIGGIDWAGGGCITITPEFIAGIDAWSLFSGDVADPDRVLLDPDAPIQICPARCSHCPPPGLSAGQEPRLEALDPPEGSVLPSGTVLMLTGRVATFRSRPLSAVFVNGQPADSVDASGRFFKQITVAPGNNLYTIEVLDRCARSETTLTLVGSGDVGQGFDLLTDVTSFFEALYRDTTFHEAAETLLVDAQARNAGQTPIDGPVLLAFGPDLAPSVDVLHAAGVTPQGEPYVVMVPEGESIGPGQTGAAVDFAFGDPERVPVRYQERWLAPGNRPPQFTSAPPTTAIVSTLYRYSPAVGDPDGHTLSFSLEAAPSDMTVDGLTGVLEWTPQAADQGLHEVALVALDGRGGRAEQRFHVQVRQPGPNRPPIFTTAPGPHAAIGAAYSYDAEALDLDGDPLAYELVTAPSGMTVESGTGLVSWPFTLPGNHDVTLRALDGQDGVALQAWTLTVGQPSQNPSAPLITSVPQTLAPVDLRYVYQPVANDPDGDPLAFTLPVSASGMSFAPQTGRMDWTPQSSQLGSHSVLLRVSDGRGGSSEQAFSISVVAGAPERPPVFESVPPRFALVGVEYVYQALATDPDFQPVTYRLRAGPAGVAIDSGTGRLSWTPAANEVGLATLGIEAEDSAGAAASQVFQVLVRAGNAAPVIGSQAPTSGVAGQTYRYAVAATDADGDVLSYALPIQPQGMTVSPVTGLIVWTPSAAQVGLHPVTVEVSDPFGAMHTQSWDVQVAADAQAPTVLVSIARPEPYCLDTPVEVCVDATDEIGVSLRTLSADSVPVPLDLRGCAVLQRVSAQIVDLEATATDPSGNIGSASRDAAFIDCDDPSAPTAEIVSPSPGSVITAPVDIVATITDNTPQFLSWEVKIARVDSEQFEVLASGSGEVVSGVVAVFDPTLLPNDSYRVQIVGNDGAQTGGIEFQYSVAGEYKPGRFTTSFTDLAIPVAGIPLAVIRTYDSLDRTQVDFGIGWTLGLSGGATDSAAESRTGDPFIDQLANEAFTRATRVYVTRPDGRRVGFTFDPVSTGFPAPMYLSARFRPDPGVEDTLQVAEGEPAVVLGVGGRFYSLFVPFNPKRYKLVTKSRVRYTYDEDAGLQHIEDANGNTLDVTPAGLVSSTGISLVFERDSQGRITRIIEPDDPNDADPPGELQYEYDASGNLTAFRDQLDNAVRYFYEDPDLPHYLTRIEDPLGRPVVRSVFDEDGCLAAQCDHNGDPATLEGCFKLDYDVAGGIQTVVDARGFRTDLFFDARGNIVRERRWLDGTSFLDTVRAYDQNDNLISVTDPDGNTSQFTYDARRNRTSKTDPTGHTFLYTYNDCNKVVTETDPAGNVTIRAYDAQCNLISEQDPLANVTQFRHDARGRRTEILDAEGSRWLFAYDSHGLPAQITDPLGNTATLKMNRSAEIEFFIDGNGRRRDYEYDGAHRLISATWNTDPPRVLTFDYDPAGRLTRAADPDSVTTIEYWGTGLVKRVEDAGTPGAPAVAITYGFLDGSELKPGYDGNGNVTHVMDSLGGLTEYRYDALGRLASVRQSGASVNEKRVDLVYDDASALVEVRRFADLAGTQGSANTFYSYDCGACPSRLTGIHHRKASDNSVLHDIDLVRNELGDILQMTDVQGLHTYTYDGLRCLLVADHPAAGVQPDETYRYDAVGNRLSSHLSAAYVYSSMLGQGGHQLRQDDQFDYQYDLAGNLIRKTDRLGGGYTEHRYDHRSRMIESVQFDAQGTQLSRSAYVYDAANRRIRADENGQVAHFVYDGRNPALKLDATGSPISRRMYNRSLDGILADEAGAQTRWFLTDQVGSVRDLVATDGTLINRFTYDSFGRLLAQSNPGVVNDLLFNGREFGGPGMLGYYRARYYDADTGRFIGPDPKSPSRYEYANNNPNVFTDPTGETVAIETRVTLCISGFVLGAVGAVLEFEGAILSAAGGAAVANDQTFLAANLLAFGVGFGAAGGYLTTAALLLIGTGCFGLGL
jgi:RHS repeat-associated protein